MAVDPLDGPTAREGCGALAEFCDHIAGKSVALQRFWRDVFACERHFAHLVSEAAFDAADAGASYG
ncbi:hypothetical protein NJB95_12580 [Brucella intermedia]|uniref:hypothetical protein n=1 Tax=Brucella intermedia TaxID=94625 RepID=UPI00209B0251|nr:hypothetical protein [Brucella intermedia]MCO7737443.1 hypothetical protein [Brucella intermedia]